MATKMIHRFILLSFFMLSSFCYGMEANDLSRAISERGAKQVLHELSYPYKKWSEFLSKVETGDKAWVSIAFQLQEASDAGASFELGHTLAHAYSMNPDSFPKEVSHLDVCKPNYMELSTKQKAEAYIVRMRGILSKTEDKYFEYECGKLIDQMSDEISEWDGTPP